MATANVDVGTGTTLGAGTSTSFTPKIESLRINGETIPIIDTTHMGTTGTQTAMTGDLKTRCSLDVNCQYNPSLTYPTGVTEVWTLTMPIPSGGTNGATLYGSGTLSEHSADIPLENKMTSDFKVEFLGAVTRTAAS